ncbi:metallophosphoesterase [Methanobacterium sp. ACI-7]|uniref:metallophosphoesterase n=1 Tax=unclassified Methanobacterium TaxID=2627676 RepID=UPI0039C2E620
MIGIMSDSHDNINAIKKAVKVFNEADVEMVIHAGDLISPFTSKEFKKLKCEFKAVFGNNDGERDGLRYFYKDICLLESLIEFEFNNRKIAVNHGTNESIIDALVKSGKYDLVVRGHTHKLEIKKEGKCMMINPGEACGYLTGEKTILLLDLEDLSYEIVKI